MRKKKISNSEKEFLKIQKDSFDELRKYANKWNRFKYKDERNSTLPFYMQLRDAMHNILSNTCVHTLSNMIKDVKKEVIQFEKERLHDESIENYDHKHVH